MDVRIAEEKTSMISTILAAGVVAAVLLPSGEPTGCMGKKRKDSVLEEDMYGSTGARQEG